MSRYTIMKTILYYSLLLKTIVTILGEIFRGKKLAKMDTKYYKNY